MSASGQALAPATAVPSTCPEILDWIDGGAGFEFVVNPIASSLDDVRDLYAEFSLIRECVDAFGATSDRLRIAAPYLDLFMSFLAPVRETLPDALELVDLLETRDPGVRRLREEVGLRAPEGRIFIRYFPDVSAMPPAVQDAFEDPETRGVTIGTRYVAMLANRSTTADAIETTLTHELVHAFLNARLGARLFSESFPGWFHEGMAITFSGSGRPHVALDPGGRRLMTIPTLEYERYERVFVFLENRLGTDAFRRAIRESVEAADAGILLSLSGFDTYETAAERADLWWRWWPVPSRWLVAPSLWIFLAALTGAGIFLWKTVRRWEPAIPNSALEVGVNEQLFEAIRSADDAGVRFALRSGAEPRVSDPEGWTPLRWAVFLNRTRAVEWLLASGAEPTRELLVFADSRDTDPEIIRMLADSLPPEGHV
jgi:hypothetical protein